MVHQLRLPTGNRGKAGDQHSRSAIYRKKRLGKDVHFHLVVNEITAANLRPFIVEPAEQGDPDTARKSQSIQDVSLRLKDLRLEDGQTVDELLGRFTIEVSARDNEQLMLVIASQVSVVCGKWNEALLHEEACAIAKILASEIADISQSPTVQSLTRGNFEPMLRDAIRQARGELTSPPNMLDKPLKSKLAAAKLERERILKRNNIELHTPPLTRRYGKSQRRVPPPSGRRLLCV